jgi:hypothetical protein
MRGSGVVLRRGPVKLNRRASPVSLERAPDYLAFFLFTSRTRAYSLTWNEYIFPALAMFEELIPPGGRNP